jgi:hypothetical protein
MVYQIIIFVGLELTVQDLPEFRQVYQPVIWIELVADFLHELIIPQFSSGSGPYAVCVARPVFYGKM